MGLSTSAEREETPLQATFESTATRPPPQRSARGRRLQARSPSRPGQGLGRSHCWRKRQVWMSTPLSLQAQWAALTRRACRSTIACLEGSASIVTHDLEFRHAAAECRIHKNRPRTPAWERPHVSSSAGQGFIQLDQVHVDCFLHSS